MKSDICIVVPTHNRAGTILRTVNSVLFSGYPHFELMVADDGSSDNTVALLEDINDPRLKVVSTPKSYGQNSARNHAIRHSSAPLITFLDSDDEILAERLGRLVTYFGHHRDCDLLIDSYVTIKSGVRDAAVFPDSTSVDSEVLRRLTINHSFPTTCSTLTVTRKAIEAMGLFNSALNRLTDRDFILSAVQSGLRCHFDNGQDVIKHQSGDSISKSYKGYYIGLDRLVDCHAEILAPPNRSLLSYLIARPLIHALSRGSWSQLRSSYKEYKDSLHLPKTLFRHLIDYRAGKKQRKDGEREFKQLRERN